jgi:hypothetical protein
MNISEYLKSHRNESDSYAPAAPRIKCKDGFSLSVQASKHTYCSPRENYPELWLSVEVGFPSDVPELIIAYAEDGGNLTNTVYGYVPTELVEQLIELHGGQA